MLLASKKKCMFSLILVISVFIVLRVLNIYPESRNTHETLIESIKNLVGNAVGKVKTQVYKDQKVVIFDSYKFKRSLKFLDNPSPGWSVVVVNIQSASQEKTCRHCVFLTHSWAKSYLAPWSRDLKPSVKVKMAAYLYLFHSKVKWIYAINKAHELPYRALSRVTNKDVFSGLVYNGTLDVFEPCHHFVDPVTWQGKRKTMTPQSLYDLDNGLRHSIYSVVDECFHSDVIDDRWKISLDQRAPIPFVPPQKFAVLNFDKILVTRKTIWTLMGTFATSMSRSSTSRSNSIKINLVVQRILWEFWNPVGFLPGKPHEKKCKFCSIASDFESYGQSFRKILKDWSCNFKARFVSCATKLLDQVLDEKGITTVLRWWLSHFTTILSSELRKQIPEVARNLNIKTGKVIPQQILFTPGKLLRKWSDGSSMPPNSLRNICKKRGGHVYESLIPNSHMKSDVVLLIIINDGKYVDIIPIIEYTYGRYFKHILYCSTRIDWFRNIYQAKNPKNPVSFISMPHHIHTQLCLIGAIKMNYDVVGYFEYSDDVLVNMWNFQNVPMNRPWFQNFYGIGKVTEELVTPGNNGGLYFPTWSYYRTQVRRFWQFFQTLRQDKKHGARVSRFLDTIAQNTNCTTCILYANADIFYIPQRIAEDFAYFAEFFDRFNVQFELTIISVITGLVPRSDVFIMSGKYIWGHLREEVRRLYSKFDLFYHAFKPSKLSDPKYASFYCNLYIPDHDKYLNQTMVKAKTD